MKVDRADFLRSATGPEGYPKEGLPEVAFAGRSNVGKSSLINCLVGRKKLALTSSTPGRTRLINFFKINERFFFVDLPGYGYAKASKKERERWGIIASRYLGNRREICALVAILDIRRDPADLDHMLIKMLEELSIPAIIALTKCDKLSSGELVSRRKSIAGSLGLKQEDLIPFSAKTGEGKEALWKAISNYLGLRKR